MNVNDRDYAKNLGAEFAKARAERAADALAELQDLAGGAPDKADTPLAKAAKSQTVAKPA